MLLSRPRRTPQHVSAVVELVDWFSVTVSSAVERIISLVLVLRDFLMVSVVLLLAVDSHVSVYCSVSLNYYCRLLWQNEYDYCDIMSKDCWDTLQIKNSNA